MNVGKGVCEICCETQTPNCILPNAWSHSSATPLRRQIALLEGFPRCLFGFFDTNSLSPTSYPELSNWTRAGLRTTCAWKSSECTTGVFSHPNYFCIFFRSGVQCDLRVTLYIESDGVESPIAQRNLSCPRRGIRIYVFHLQVLFSRMFVPSRHQHAFSTLL